METRKIQKTGGSTYIVSLPKHWVISSKLKEGETVSMTIESGGTLTIDPGLGSKKPSSRVDVLVDDKEDELHFLRRLIGLYISGHDEIVVRGKARISPEIRKIVSDFTRKVIGSEIVEESSTSVTIQDVADHSHLDMRKILRRMHLVSRSMHADAMQALKSSDRDLAENVLARDDEIDRLYLFVAKQQSMILRDPAVARRMGIGISEASFYLSAAKALERIADHAARIAHSASALSSGNLNDRLVKDIEGYSSTVLSVLDRSMDSMLKVDMLTANLVADESEQLRKDGEKLIEQIMNHRVKFAVPFARVVESLERTALYSVDIAEIAINLAEKG